MCIRDRYKKGLLFIFINEVANEIGADLGAVFAICEIFFFSIKLEQGVYESSVDSFTVFIRTSTPCMLPEAGFLETEMLGRVWLVPQLPLASDSCLVTSCLKLMSECGLPTVQHPKLHIVSDIVLSGHNFGSRGGTDRIGKTVGETNALLGQFVEVG